MTTDQRIISIHNYHDFSSFTVLMCCQINIRTLTLGYSIVNDGKLIFCNLIHLHVSLNVFLRRIIGGITYINNVIVLVLLLENGVKISQIYPAYGRIKGIDYNTESDLFMGVGRYVVLVIVIVLLFNHSFL